MHFRTVRSESRAGMLTIIFGFAVLSSLWIGFALRGIAEHELTAEMDRGRVAYRQFSGMRRDLLVMAARTVADAPYVKATLTIPGVDPATVFHTVSPLFEKLGHDLLLVTDSAGILLADGWDEHYHGVDLAGFDGVAATLAGQSGAGLWRYRDEAFEVVVTPISSGNTAVGALALGERIDAEYVGAVAEAVGLDALVFDEGGLIAAFWRDAPADDLPADELVALQAALRDGRSEDSSSLVHWTRNGLECVATGMSIPGSNCTLVISEPVADHMRPIRRARNLLLILGLTVTVLAYFFSRTIARRVGGPVQDLTAASNLVAAGDLTAIVPERGNEELRTLAKAFNHMAGRISELIESEKENMRAVTEAEALARVKSRFLANMSHEIRTPMNGVVGLTELLLDTDLTGDQRELAGTVQGCARGLIAVINDVLDISKAETGMFELEVVDLNLQDLVENTCDMVAQQAQAKGLELLQLIHWDVPRALRGDPARLRQTLLNLIANAIKFTEEGEVLVEVSRESESDTHITLRFSLQDTGVGIPEVAIPRLFKPFSQVDPSTSRRFGGTGLGLSIAKHITELMGGQIGVESQEGDGSTFWFTAVLEKRSQALEREAPLELDGLLVVVADDNASSRNVLAHYLSHWGCRVSHAEHGAAALEELRRASLAGNPFGLALLEAQMPDMSGLEVAQELRAAKDVPACPVILLTSIRDRHDSTELAQLGVSGHLSKPVKQGQLQRCIEHALKRESAELSQRPAESIAEYSRLPHAVRQRVSILVVEDELINQKLAVMLLETAQFRCEVANDGQEAVEAVAAGRFDLVLMDCQMPVMDGYEATRVIRKAEAGTDRHVPILAMTASVMAEDRQRCFAAGMDAFLSKPIEARVLFAALDEWLLRSGLSA